MASLPATSQGYIYRLYSREHDLRAQGSVLKVGDIPAATLLDTRITVPWATGTGIYILSLNIHRGDWGDHHFCDTSRWQQGHLPHNPTTPPSPQHAWVTHASHQFWPLTQKQKEEKASWFVFHFAKTLYVCLNNPD